LTFREFAMRPSSPSFNPKGFLLFPTNVIAGAILIDWERVEELYRDAFEEARAALRPPVMDRLAPYWN
jgi:hypothetical protein